MILFNATILQLKKYESRLTKRILMIKEVSQIVICQQEQIIKEQPQKKCHLSIHEVQNSKGMFSTEINSDKQNSQEKISFALMMMMCLGAVAAFAANPSYCDESVTLVTFEVGSTLNGT